MEPLKPERVKDILSKSPKSTPRELAEYEYLLSKRFRKDPSIQGFAGAPDPDEVRLQELAKKLFGS